MELNERHPPGEELKNMGGIAAILTYAIDIDSAKIDHNFVEEQQKMSARDAIDYINGPYWYDKSELACIFESDGEENVETKLELLNKFNRYQN